ncbi:MAG: hypothetical protein EZS28_041729, partial [Streblomastix strix]
GMRFIDCAKG